MNPLAYLFGLEQFGIKFGLDNITAILSRLGHPQRAYRSVHIAGTNGKGSVTAMLDAMLRAAGHRTARYTSPHLVDLSERFVIDGKAVSEDAMVNAVSDVLDAVEALRADGTLEVQPTFFEVTTAVAFELFRRARVEIAVVEVGLGGRLDATNVLTPDATAITSIAFDHQLYLGSTLREIAIEKAGIIKPGVPVVIGDMADEAASAIADVARARGADVIRASGAGITGRAIALPGAHQRLNAAIAVALARVLDARGVAVPASAIDAGLAGVEWPGRIDRRRLPDGREVLLDAAHNPAGAEALAAYLRDLSLPAAEGAKRPLVFAAMRDKDVTGMFGALLPCVSRLIVTSASNPRSADAAELAARAIAVAPTLDIAVEASLPRALDAGWRTSPRIVVAGSIFLLGDVLRQLGLHC